jgi:hypothetical protein
MQPLSFYKICFERKGHHPLDSYGIFAAAAAAATINQLCLCRLFNSLV